jgi:diguanylate cyclase (GGDEF)-like protein/PAS domain S-box-containing protein
LLHHGPYRGREGTWHARADDRGLLAALARSAGAAVVTGDLDGTITSWNAGAERIFGYRSEEMVGRCSDILEPPDRWGEGRTLLAQLCQGEQVDLLDTVRLHKDGSRVHLTLSIAPVFDRGLVTGNVTIAHDDTPHHTLVQRGEERLQALVQHSVDLIAVVDSSYAVVYANPSAQAALGFDPETQRGTSLLTLVHPDDAQSVASALAELVRHPDVQAHTEFRLLDVEGQWRYFMAAASMLDADAATGEIVINGRDVTNKRAADSWFRQLLETADEGIWTLDTEGITTFANQRMTQILGRSSEELVGTSVFAYVEEETLEDLLETLARNFTTGVRIPVDTHLLRPDGTAIAVRMSTSPLRGEDGEINGGLGLVTDVSAQERTQEELTLRDAWLDAIVMNAFDLVVAVSEEGIITFTTPSTLAILGLEETQPVVGTNIASFVHPEDLEETAAAFGRAVAGSNPNDPYECRVRRGDGTYMWFEFTATSLIGEKGIDAVIVHGRDVTERVEAAEQVARNEAWLQAILHQAFDVVAALTPDGLLTFATPGIEAFVGRSRDSLIGVQVMDLIHPEDRATAANAMANVLAVPDASESVEVRVLRPDGSSIWIEAIVTNLLLDPVVERIVINARDITDRHLAEAKIAYHAMHDSLTGLPNRFLLGDRLEHALARRDDLVSSVAVTFIDLDHFKVLNDSSGHSIGDSALKAVAERLRQTCRVGDTVARFGGDEFVLVSESVSGLDEAREVGERVLREVFEKPFQVDSGSVHISASIGVALGDGEVSPDRLMADADTAMYRAKAHGRSRVELFDTSMRVEVTARQKTIEALRKAIDDGDVVAYYQPIVSLPGRVIVGAEALVRLHHPVLGLLNPADFIPLAEATGLIDAIGTRVFELACIELRRNLEAAPDMPFSMSINVSPVQLRSKQILELPLIAERIGVDPRSIVLEITESTLIGEDEHMPDAIAALRAHGFRVAVDDFGTGYSSLSHLKRLSVDVVKIDQTFTAGVGTSVEDTAIVQAILSMARALDLSVVAEGVETTAQAEALTDMQCPQAQGYLFSPPVSSEEFEGLVAAQFLSA